MDTTPAQALDNLATAHIAPNGSPILPVAHGLYTAQDGDALTVFTDAEGAHVVGYITKGAAGWFASYLGGAQLVGGEEQGEALHFLSLQHDAARYVSRMVRAIRPAPEVGTNNAWERGYNAALRDVEHLLTACVGSAPDGEGYTAITRGW